MLTIFRGDRLSYGDQPISDFCLPGLLAKFLRGGTSNQFRNREFVDYVLAHVGWEKGTDEEKFARTSPMISFSESRAVAEKYMRGEPPVQVVPCAVHKATHFIYDLSVAPTDLESRPRGIAGTFLLRYMRSQENCREHIERAKTDGPLFGLLGDTIEQAAIRDAGEHVAVLVNVVEFLRAYRPRSDRTYRIALDRATDDREWLLYPADPMHDGSGVSAIFHANRHLRMEGHRAR